MADGGATRRRLGMAGLIRDFTTMLSAAPTIAGRRLAITAEHGFLHHEWQEIIGEKTMATGHIIRELAQGAALLLTNPLAWNPLGAGLIGYQTARRIFDPAAARMQINRQRLTAPDGAAPICPELQEAAKPYTPDVRRSGGKAVGTPSVDQAPCRR